MQNNAAYDYSTQQWVEGSEARNLRREQAIKELSLLRGPNGERYAQFAGIRDRGAAIARLEMEVGTL